MFFPRISGKNLQQDPPDRQDPHVQEDPGHTFAGFAGGGRGAAARAPPGPPQGGRGAVRPSGFSVRAASELDENRGASMGKWPQPTGAQLELNISDSDPLWSTPAWRRPTCLWIIHDTSTIFDI